MMKFKSRRRSGAGRKGSPAKGRSPFKRRSISRTKPVAGALDLEQVTEDSGSKGSSGPVQANIRVAVRVRPENERELASCYRNVIDVVDDTMLVFDPKESSDDFFFHGQRQQRRDLNKKVNRDQKFAFDTVYGPNSTNGDIFEGSTKDLVDVVFNGYNCSVFVYGATGAGKTHTMLGSEDNPGIVFRTVMELYARIELIKEESDVEVVVSYLEIYNENVLDLINPSTQLQVREDGVKGVNIPGLSRHRPAGPDELLRLLQYGNGNRTQHPTDANKESSRSHAVFQVYIKQTGKSSGLSADVKVAKLSMIDLAGSERGSATSSRGAARFREGANINKSLLALGNCINALAEGSKYIPYRNSKLTRLLKDSIGGNCRTVMISNVSPSSMTYEDTYNTLRYADRAKKIKIKLKKNVLSVDFQVGQYAKIVEDLKIQLSECKARVAALEDENVELKQQLELAASQTSDQIVPVPAPVQENLSQNNEEIELLKAQLSELQNRQKDYDDLQQRLNDFETKQRLEKLDEINRQNRQVIDQQQEDNMNNYVEVLKKCQQFETKIRQLKLKKEQYQQTLNRARILTPDEWFHESESKFQKMITDLDKKIQKQTKQENAIKESLKIIESEVPMEDEMFSKRLQTVKGEVQLEHALKVTEIMFHDQARTESLLMDSLEQLKKLFMCSYSTFQKTETEKEFKDLLSKVSCSVVQFRENKITENNQETTYDRLGEFYGNIVNLENLVEEPENEPIQPNINETIVIENRANDTISAAENISELMVTIPLPDEDNDDEVEEEEEQNSAPWRPPTPPKASPKRASLTSGESPALESTVIVESGAAQIPILTRVSPRVTPTNLFPSVLQEDSHTPTPPQLLTVETSHLFKPIMPDMNTTFDKEEGPAKVMEEKENVPLVDEEEGDESFKENINSTIVISHDLSGVEPLDQSDNATTNTSSAVIVEKVVPFTTTTTKMQNNISSQKQEELSSSSSPIMPLGSLENSPSMNDGLRRGTFTINPAVPKVAKVSPMVPEKPKVVNSASVPTGDRRPQNQRNAAVAQSLRRQVGIKSTSNLRLHERVQPLNRRANEAPDGGMMTSTPGGGAATPSYLKPTSASSKKHFNFNTPVQASNENHGASGRNVNRNAGAIQKHANRMRKDPSSTTLKPINK